MSDICGQQFDSMHRFKGSLSNFVRQSVQHMSTDSLLLILYWGNLGVVAEVFEGREVLRGWT